MRGRLALMTTLLLGAFAAGGWTAGARQDADEPDSNIKKVKSQEAADLQGFSGTASAPGDELVSVSIAVVRVSGGVKAAQQQQQPTKCLRLGKNGKLKRGTRDAKGRCKPTGFLRAQGTTKWQFELKQALPTGKYVVYSRAKGKAGNEAPRWNRTDGNRRRFNLK